MLVELICMFALKILMIYASEFNLQIIKEPSQIYINILVDE